MSPRLQESKLGDRSSSKAMVTNLPSKTTRPKVICVTPVRNEAWIIEPFLRAAELWADHIILADQTPLMTRCRLLSNSRRYA